MPAKAQAAGQGAVADGPGGVMSKGGPDGDEEAGDALEVTASDMTLLASDTSSIASCGSEDSDVEPPFYHVKLAHAHDDYGVRFDYTQGETVIVAHVEHGSPAAAAGVPVFRTVVSINGRRIVDEESVRGALETSAAQGRPSAVFELSDEVEADYARTAVMYILGGVRSDDAAEELGFEYVFVEKDMLVTKVDPHGVFAYANIPPGAVIDTVKDRAIRCDKDWRKAAAKLKKKEDAHVEVKYVVRKGRPEEAARGKGRAGGGGHASPPRDAGEAGAREVLRRELWVHAEAVSRREHRVERCSGYALTHPQFVAHYGEEVGEERWRDAYYDTPVLAATEVEALPKDYDHVGARVQIEETGAVVILAALGAALSWAPAEALTKQELAFQRQLRGDVPPDDAGAPPASLLPAMDRYEPPDVQWAGVPAAAAGSVPPPQPARPEAVGEKNARARTQRFFAGVGRRLGKKLPAALRFPS